MDGPTKPDLRIGYLEHRSMRADECSGPCPS